MIALVVAVRIPPYSYVHAIALALVERAVGGIGVLA